MLSGDERPGAWRARRLKIGAHAAHGFNCLTLGAALPNKPGIICLVSRMDIPHALCFTYSDGSVLVRIVSIMTKAG